MSLSKLRTVFVVETGDESTAPSGLTISLGESEIDRHLWSIAVEGVLQYGRLYCDLLSPNRNDGIRTILPGKVCTDPEWGGDATCFRRFNSDFLGYTCHDRSEKLLVSVEDALSCILHPNDSEETVYGRIILIRFGCWSNEATERRSKEMILEETVMSHMQNLARSPHSSRTSASELRFLDVVFFWIYPDQSSASGAHVPLNSTLEALHTLWPTSRWETATLSPQSFSSRPDLSVRATSLSVTSPSVLDAMSSLVSQHLGLSTLRIVGIPMKETGKTSSKGQYDVLLLYTPTPPLSEHGTFTRNPHTGVLELVLRWMKLEKHITMPSLGSTGLHCVSPLNASASPTVCLLKHLQSGRPVSLALQSPEDTLQAQPTSLNLTHFLRLDNLLSGVAYLHWLTRQPTSFPSGAPPQAPLSAPSRHRIEAFIRTFVQSHSLRPALTTHHEEAYQTWVSQLDPKSLRAEERADSERQDTCFLRTCLPPPKDAAGDSTKPVTYWTRGSLERASRYFPLCSEHSPVLGVTAADDDARALLITLRPIAEALTKPPEDWRPDEGDIAVECASRLFHLTNPNATSLEKTRQQSTAEQLLSHLSSDLERKQHLLLCWAELLVVSHSHPFTPLSHIGTRCPKLTAHAKVSYVLRELSGLGGMSAHRSEIENAESEDDRDNRENKGPPTEIEGVPSLPLGIGRGITLHSLGRIVTDRVAYHSERYPFPVGFRSSRFYSSALPPTKKVRYYSEILDGGEQPIFRVYAEDRPDVYFEETSPSAAWTAAMAAVSNARAQESNETSKDRDREEKDKKKSSANVSGPSQYGLDQPLVFKMLMCLPGARSLTKLVKHFGAQGTTRFSRKDRSATSSESLRFVELVPAISEAVKACLPEKCPLARSWQALIHTSIEERELRGILSEEGVKRKHTKQQPLSRIGNSFLEKNEDEEAPRVKRRRKLACENPTFVPGKTPVMRVSVTPTFRPPDEARR
eukprot:Rmarinus@m.18048